MIRCSKNLKIQIDCVTMFWISGLVKTTLVTILAASKTTQQDNRGGGIFVP